MITTGSTKEIERLDLDSPFTLALIKGSQLYSDLEEAKSNDSNKTECI